MSGFVAPGRGNLLMGEAPRAVVIGGRRYPVNWGYRYGMLFDSLLWDDGLPRQLKERQALALFYPDCPGDRSAALETALWFWLCGQGEANGASGSDGAGAGDAGVGGGGGSGAFGGGGGQRLLDFERDAGALYAAFMADYGLDLSSRPDLHWWHFCALLAGLKSDNLLCKVVRLRGIDPMTLPADQRPALAGLQKQWALESGPGGPPDETLRALESALQGSGDVRDILMRG